MLQMRLQVTQPSRGDEASQVTPEGECRQHNRLGGDHPSQGLQMPTVFFHHNLHGRSTGAQRI